MNRADQAPEPSMEELLASIRLIISDTGKVSSPPLKETRLARSPLGEQSLATPAQTSPASDDVLDLTEELLFPEEAAVLATETASAPKKAGGDPFTEELAVPEEPHASASLGQPPAVASGFPPAAASTPSSPRRSVSWPERRPESSPPASQPMWSRRELPSAAQFQAAPARPPKTGSSQARSWAEDIQMPVPEGGPVSLIGAEGGNAQTQGRDTALEGTGARFGHEKDRSAAGRRQDRESEGHAVAALAERLARSAMGALDSNELENAQAVDFSHLDAESRAEVTEKLADAIERESAVHGNTPLPSLLDEVFRQDFIRHTESGAVISDEAAASEDSAASHEEESAHKMAVNEETLDVLDTPRPQRSALTVQPGSAKLENTAAPGRTGQEMRLAPRSPAPAPVPVHPSHAQFAGSAQAPAPVQTGRGLEEAVREMLRPLLVQWLNDNMPRILENAIREEINIRGIFPKTES